MSQASLDRALPAGDRLLIDTSTLIAYFNRAEAVFPVAEHIVDELIQTGRNPALVSMMSVMEVLVRPIRQNPGMGYRHVIDFLTKFPNLHPTEIDLPVAQEAASLRATFRFAAPDALAITTGIVGQVGHLVTNDQTWATRLQPIAGRIRVCLLSNHLPFP